MNLKDLNSDDSTIWCNVYLNVVDFSISLFRLSVLMGVKGEFPTMSTMEKRSMYRIIFVDVNFLPTLIHVRNIEIFLLA